MAKIVPGILTNDEEDYVQRLRKAEHVSDLIQIDLVDGKFANNTSVDTTVIAKYPSSSQLEVQLMVVYPQNYISELAKMDFVSRIIFPYEADTDTNQDIYLIKSFGKQAGLSLNPDTPVEATMHFFDDIDLLELMTGNPGFSGQKLGDSTYERIAKVKRLKSDLALEIDIGVNEKNASKLAAAGADFLVTSSAIYNAPDFKIAFDKIERLAKLKN